MYVCVRYGNGSNMLYTQHNEHYLIFVSVIALIHISDN